MSEATQPHDGDESLIIESEEELRREIAETFEPHLKSRQVTEHHNAHIDGQQMQQDFHMKSLADVLRRKEEDRHPLATEPRAFVDPLVHIRDHDAYLLENKVDLTTDERRYPRPRRRVLEWLTEHDERLAAMNKGGTDIFLHGLPGSTKTTCMHYLTVRVMEANNETVFWRATPGRSEWLPLARWATVAWPSSLEKVVKVVPFNSDIDPFEIEITDVVRDVLEYDDPLDLMEQVRDRPDGQFYVTYPDPEFRQCEYLTGWNYTNIWEAPSLREETPLIHWWFAFAQARVSGPYGYWTTFVLDEADELLPQEASKDDHDTYQKVLQFKDGFRDFRKDHLTLFLAAHSLAEVHEKVRKKLRWTLTMNQEDPPDDAPVDGPYTRYMDLGEGMIWKGPKSASFGWPNMKRYFSIPAKIEVEYPSYDTAKGQTSVSNQGVEADD